MCGRFTNRYTWRELHALYMLSVGFPQPNSNFQPRYNIAPTQMAFVVREKDDARELVELRWGLVPSWAKDAKGAVTRQLTSSKPTPQRQRAFGKNSSQQNLHIPIWVKPVISEAAQKIFKEIDEPDDRQ